MNELSAGDYKPFLKEITEKIRNSRYEAMRTLNTMREEKPNFYEVIERLEKIS